MRNCLGYALWNWQCWICAVSSIHNDKRVINTNAKNHEGQHGVHWCVDELKPHRKTIACRTRYHNGDHACKGEQRPGFYFVAKPTKIEDQIDDHDHERSVDEPNIATDHCAKCIPHCHHAVW